jgi:hypothetical protein
MLKLSGAAWVLVGASVVFVLGTPATAATVSLRAVRVNGAAIPPANSITIANGDEIETEIYLSGWGAELPQGVHFYGADVAGAAGFQSGSNGTILPKGWRAPLTPIECSDARPCPSHYPVCSNDYGCTCPGHDSDAGAYIDLATKGGLCYDQGCICAVDISSLNYRYLCVRSGESSATDTGVALYLGTLVLVVSDDACGDFTIGFSQGSNSSIIGDAESPPTAVELVSQPLAIHVQPCILEPQRCDPDHCFVDSRMPHAPDNAAMRLNTNTLVMQFATPGLSLTPTDFAVEVFPDGIVPGIASVTPVANDATIVLNRRIDPKAWTCIHHIAENRRCCMGSLPGDADSNFFVGHPDLFELVDNLNGEVQPSLTVEKCDMDRSALCTPADLLMASDMSNGAQAFQPYAGATLPACPPIKINPCEFP